MKTRQEPIKNEWEQKKNDVLASFQRDGEDFIRETLMKWDIEKHQASPQ
jgi:hypothetical protein